MNRNWLYNKTTILAAFGLIFCSGLKAQGWKPANDGFQSTQYGNPGSAINLQFKTNGPLGKDWIYGGYWDSDSIRRCVAYREGGKWVPIPFSGYKSIIASDIEMYGDTLYIAGTFRYLTFDNSTDTIPGTYLIKYFNDSLWADHPSTIIGGQSSDMSARGDSLLIWGSSYYNPPKVIYTHFMSPDKGQTWQTPYSVIHPTDSTANFGAEARIEILENGDILTINNGSPMGNRYGGLSRWDGQQWHAYGNGLFGWTSRVFDFEFYDNELYMGGSFNKDVFPNDPAQHIASWDGSQWREVGGGLVGSILDMFVAKSVLYARISGPLPPVHRFGDAAIPYLAGWNGRQWCGTPTVYGNYAPQHFGVINDTLYVNFHRPGVINGDSVGYLAFFDGDYVNGPNAICSTPGLGQEETASKSGLELYPVPANEELHLVAPSTPIHSIKIYNLTGQAVFQRQFFNQKEEVVIDISQLVPGLYFLNLNGQGTQRFVKN